MPMNGRLSLTAAPAVVREAPAGGVQALWSLRALWALLALPAGAGGCAVRFADNRAMSAMHLLSQLDLIRPSTEDERAQWQDARQWLASGAPLYRLAKPATPPKHLVAYFPVVDDGHILLVDHRNAQRWLPSGGHVEPGEDPRQTVVRELHEELGIVIAEHQVPDPLMVTVTHTVGLTAGHTDVSLWYPIRHPRQVPVVFDANEFHGVRWFPFADAAQLPSDPNLAHFLAKLVAGG